MSVQLNHTIVWCRDKQKSATFFTEVLGLQSATRFGPMLVVQLNNNVSLDFYENDGKISSQHYAFLIGEDDFDQTFARIHDRGLQYWADPGKHPAGKQVVVAFQLCVCNPIGDGLPSLLRNLELHWPTGLLLQHHRAP